MRSYPSGESRARRKEPRGCCAAKHDNEFSPQHGACIAGNSEQLMGRSRGGPTTKILAAVDTRGLPVRLALTTGEAHDNPL